MNDQRERQRPAGPDGSPQETDAERERLAERRERTERLLREAGAAATAAVLSRDAQAFIQANRQRGGQ